MQRTHELLEAHNEQARQVPAWRLLDGQQASGGSTVTAEASPDVAGKQQELHQGEIRARATQGSASTHDRRNQRRRDQR
ncbi:hypothetical protein EIM48_12870 [Pseudoxanthomonas sp. SGNA-20]|uniref:Uncharacterized protein n=1 Tax=Pseudoxanthomonas taiwanensis J19 TaxID=935569 RepID=A0A562D6S1_9GAMM|nr:MULTISPECIES: hypothetical protein [Pseudoxanthomonas]RRN54766.1 hypothetical protein EIM48_12870 [Pseudoxanthomonas sp. SGNA-20]TWH05457.1 hypothetical protein L613_000600000500 [Pseudoxanthomonas taiwanensis J19]